MVPGAKWLWPMMEALERGLSFAVGKDKIEEGEKVLLDGSINGLMDEWRVGIENNAESIP